MHLPPSALERDEFKQGAAIARPARGVIVPLVTPLRSRDEIDVEGLERLVAHVLEGGVHGIFLLGTSGESAALCGSVRRELVRRVCDRVRDQVPVLVGISDTALVESLRLADDVAQIGASAVVVTTPYYLPLEARELVDYVRTVSFESPLPVFLYNMPHLTQCWFSTEVLDQLLDLENVVGLKDSSGNPAYFAAARASATQRPDWSLLVGSEAVLGTAVRDGAHGGVTGGANVWPQLFVSLYEAAVANNQARVAALEEQAAQLSSIYRFGGFAVGSIRGIKSALKLMSIAGDQMAAPFLSVDKTQEQQIAEKLRQLGLLGDRLSPSTTTVHRREMAALKGPHLKAIVENAVSIEES